MLPEPGGAFGASRPFSGVPKQPEPGFGGPRTPRIGPARSHRILAPSLGATTKDAPVSGQSGTAVPVLLMARPEAGDIQLRTRSRCRLDQGLPGSQRDGEGMRWGPAAPG